MSDLGIYNIETLLSQTSQGFRPKYLFFWGHQPRRDGQIGKQCFSQWWASPFEIEGLVYPTAEHYMMAEKARLFGDDITCEKILAATHPGEAKKLGRKVKEFDEKVWLAHRFGIVVCGNEAKFGQHDKLRRFLVNTKERILVEASPHDQVWGIGLAEDDAQAMNPENWQGLNLLGFALMQVRDRLGY